MTDIREVKTFRKEEGGRKGKKRRQMGEREVK